MDTGIVPLANILKSLWILWYVWTKEKSSDPDLVQQLNVQQLNPSPGFVYRVKVDRMLSWLEERL